jgi:hypothetical protein
MRLNSTRCTLGNGEGCTVRLHDSSLRPMHAVILRDAHRVLLRAYTVPIEVNGHLTGESFLHVGDTFTLGSYHFELLEGSGIDSSIAHTRQPSTRALGTSSVHSSPDDDLPVVSHGATAMASATVRRRPRLSFQGGDLYISEAMQALIASAAPSLPSQSLERDTIDAVHVMDLPVATARQASDDEIEQLRRDLEVWHRREQDWKEQQARTNDELALAVSRFHQSQERANQASDAVSELRERIDQLTRELDALVVDSREYRTREAKLLAEVDSAYQARERAILERDEAIGRVNAAQRSREEAERKSEEAKHLREIALGEIEIVVRDRDRALSALDDAENARKGEAEKTTQVAKSLTLANEQLQSLTHELATATNQLAICKRDLADSYTKVDQLQVELRRLESECAETRKHAESAAADRQLVESLRAKLDKLESSRNVDRLSWECEATQLQQTVQQLSLELAAVNSQLTKAESDNESLRSQNDSLQSQQNVLQSQRDTIQSEQAALRSQQESLQSEYEATQAELNSTYERLTVARKELSLRPSAQQWDELQTKLEGAEQQLVESEKLLASLRADYDELLKRQANPSTTPEKIETAAPSWAEALPPVSEDQGWPTYDSLSRESVGLANRQPLLAIEANAPVVEHGVERGDEPADEPAEPLLSNEHQVADRLQNYMSHEATRHVQNHEHEDEPVVAPAEPSRPLNVSSSWATYRSELPADEASTDETADSEAQSMQAPNMEVTGNDLHDDDLYRQDAPSKNGNDWAVQWSTIDEPEHHDLGTPDGSASGSAIATDDSEEMHEGDLARRLIAQLSGADDDSPPAPATAYEDKRPIVLDKQNRFQVSFPEESQDELKAITESSFSHVFSEKAKESLDRTYVLSESETREAIDRELDDSNLDLNDGHTYQMSNIPAFNDLDEFQSTSDEPQEDVASSEPTSLASSGIPETTSASSSDTEDDDSIEAYMNRLLQRVQGQSSSTTSTSVSKGSASNTVAESVRSQSPIHVTNSVTNDSVTSSKPMEVIDPSAPLIPRSQAPEAAGNLAAMREIANSSANSAISVSVRSQAQQMKSRAIMDLLQAAVVMVCAFAFFACGIKIPSMRYIWFAAATLATALAFFYVMDMVKKLATAKITYENSNNRGSEEERDV